MTNNIIKHRPILDGKQVYLLQTAQLNKNSDSQIKIPSRNFQPLAIKTHKPQHSQLSHEEVLNLLLAKVQKINFRKKCGLQPGQELVKKHLIITSIEEILRKADVSNCSICTKNGLAYVYNGAYWKTTPEEELSNFLGQAAEKLGVPKYDAHYYEFRSQLVKQFFSTSSIQRIVDTTDKVLVNLQNGTFSVNSEQQCLKKFDKGDFLRYQLPFEFNENATAPQFEKYLNEVLPDKSQQNVLAEFIGYIFIKQSVLKLEKALILCGTGANGKSVFFDIITHLLGTQNVSNYSLQSLTNETGYQRAQISGKLLNYASEISPSMDSTIFKQLVSGEPVEARLPYKDPFIIEHYAKLMFNTNHLPKDVEQNEAFFRRFIIIPFEVTIPDNERDPELARKIISQELPGVLNWVLQGLNRLLQQKGFTKSEKVNAAIEEYKKQSDSVTLFLEEDGYIIDVSEEISLKDMYLKYFDYCKTYRHKARASKTFSSRLRQLGYKLERKRDGNVVGAKKISFNEVLQPSPDTETSDANEKKDLSIINK